MQDRGAPVTLVAINTKPPAAPINPSMPLWDAEAAALFLTEHMPPEMRRELGRLLIQSDWGGKG